MGLEGGTQAWILSLNPRNGWMDKLRFYVVLFFNIVPVLSGRWEEDKYKAVCNGTAT